MKKTISYVVMEQVSENCLLDVRYNNGDVIEHSSFEEANHDRIYLQPEHDGKLVVVKQTTEVIND